MRNVIRTMLMVFGPFIGIGLSIYVGIMAASFIAFFVALGASIGAIFVVDRMIDKAGRINMDAWLSKNDGCKYKYAWDGDGIAVDTGKKVIHLTAKFARNHVSKTYSFEDVREWGFEAPGSSETKTYGRVGLQVTTQVMTENAVSMLKSIENTGLWIKVRDIEFPRWFIRFHGKSAQDKGTIRELEKWMEILSQNINER